MMLDDRCGGTRLWTKQDPRLGLRAPTDHRVNEAMARSTEPAGRTAWSHACGAPRHDQSSPCALARVLRRRRLHVETTSEGSTHADWIEGDYICLYAPDGRIMGTSAFSATSPRRAGR